MWSLEVISRSSLCGWAYPFTEGGVIERDACPTRKWSLIHQREPWKHHMRHDQDFKASEIRFSEC